jgi:uncharacterized protein YbjQ (UPF0145 family)
MLPEMIFGGIAVQIVELKLNEARWDCLEELRREAQRVSLIKQLRPRPVG